MASRNKIKAELQKASEQAFENLMDEINGKGKRPQQKFRDESKTHKKTKGNKKNGYKSEDAFASANKEAITKQAPKSNSSYSKKEEDRKPKTEFKPQRKEDRNSEQRTQKAAPVKERKTYSKAPKTEASGTISKPRQTKDFQRGNTTTNPPVKKVANEHKPNYAGKDKAKEQTTKPARTPKRPSLAFITQTEDGHATLQAVLTSKKIPCAWDFKSKERVRIITKADGSSKSAIYIPKADSNTSTIPEGGNALIGISKSNLIIDYLPLIDKVIVYKVNNIVAKGDEEEIIQLAVYNTCIKGKWGREPFDTIKKVYEMIKNAYTDDNWKGYYATYIQDKSVGEQK